MKKIIVLLCFVLPSVLAFAQNLDEVKKLVKGEWNPAQAKIAVDKYLSNPKNEKDADAYYYKAVIYNKYSKDPGLKIDCPDCKLQAFEAYKKCKELDNKNTLLILDQGHGLVDIYTGFYEDGVEAFNGSKYALAFNNFKNSLYVGDYLRENQIAKIPVLDTAVVLNAALAEKTAGNYSVAVIYYQKLANANLSTPEYDAVYEYLVYYYNIKNKTAEYTTALAQGKKYFPADPYWKSIETARATEGLGKNDLFKKYDDLLAKDPSNYEMAYNYSVELYNYIYANPDSSIKVESYKPHLYEQLKKTIAIKSTPEDNLLMARYLYNTSFDKRDAASSIRGGSPDNVKKRKALNDASIENMNECIPYSETAANYYGTLATLKPNEKDNYKASLIILKSIYEVKKDAAKQAMYAAKLKTLN